MELLTAIAKWARSTPDATALEDFRGENVGYAELATLSDRAAAGLRERGIGPGDRVGLVLPRCTDLFVLELAILKAGACFTPVDPAQPTERIALLLAQAAVSLVVTDDVGLTEATGIACTGVARLLSGPSSADSSRGVGSARPADSAYCLFTSGSTGLPAAVLITRVALDVYTGAYADLVQSRPGERSAQIGSPGFDVTIDEIWPFLTTGATVVIASDTDRSSPHRLAAWLRRSKITTTYVPPLLLESMFRLVPTVDLGDVRLIRTGGERLADYPPADFPCRVLNEYGPTETVAGALFCDVSAWQDRRLRPPIGRPLPHIRLSVRDENRSVIPPGTTGELYVGGPTVGVGYLDDEERTTHRFVTLEGTRWFRTGDIVRQLPSGDFEFLHRIDNQVQLLGRRVELGEVEEAVRAYPPVRRTVVLAPEDAHGRAGHLVCWVQWATDGERADTSALRAHLARLLPGYMIPAEIHAVDGFPVTPAGKVDKSTLIGSLGGAARPTSPVTPEDLVPLWEKTLDVTGLTPDDDFFLHGGTSPRTLEIVASVRELFGCPVSARDVFNHPTPRRLAQFLVGGHR